MNDRTRIRIFEPTRRWRLSTVIVVATAAAARVAAYLTAKDTSSPASRYRKTEHNRISTARHQSTLPLSPTLYHHRFSVCLEPTPLRPANAEIPPRAKTPESSKNSQTQLLLIYSQFCVLLYLRISQWIDPLDAIYIYDIYIWNSLILLSSLVEAPPFIRSLVRSFVRTRWGKNWKAVMEVERSTLLRRSFDSHVRVNVNRVGMGRGRAARTWTHAFIFPSTETWHTVRTGGRPRSRRSHWRVAGWLCEPPDSSTGAMEPARDARGVARQRGMEGGGWIERWTAEGGVGGVGWTERRRVGV